MSQQIAAMKGMTAFFNATLYSVYILIKMKWKWDSNFLKLGIVELLNTSVNSANCLWQGFPNFISQCVTTSTSQISLVTTRGSLSPEEKFKLQINHCQSTSFQKKFLRAPLSTTSLAMTYMHYLHRLTNTICTLQKQQ